jgi:DNA processing protein
MDKGLDIERLALIAVAHAAMQSRHEPLLRLIYFINRNCLEGKSVEAQSRELKREAGSFGQPLDWAVKERCERWLATSGNRLLAFGDQAYPSLLQKIPKPPPVLFACGRSELLLATQIAVVGSRRATAAGRENAYELARGLADAGLVVTSGLASGIDSAAHRGALDATGATVAVFGCGIDRIYPSTNRDLALEIAADGVLLSEFPLGYAPTKYSFPQRNRVISGLAVGTLVVEAAQTSGSLITALQALEQGREVFAVPGPIRSALSKGCHALIRQGAVLTETVEDVLQEFPSFERTKLTGDSRPESLALPSLTAREAHILESCDFEPIAFDQLVDKTGLTAPEVSSILVALEMKGLVRSDRGGAFVRTGRAHS